jgi:hypothetical protein
MTWILTRGAAVVASILVLIHLTAAVAQVQPGQPLSEQEIGRMLDRRTPQAAIVTLALERGVGFDITPETEERLRKGHGAGSGLLEALKQSRLKAKAAADEGDNSFHDKRFPSRSHLKQIETDECKYLIFPGTGPFFDDPRPSAGLFIPNPAVVFDRWYRRLPAGEKSPSALVLKNYGPGAYDAEMRFDSTQVEPKPDLLVWKGTFQLANDRFYKFVQVGNGLSKDSRLTLSAISKDEALRFLATVQQLKRCDTLSPGVW